MKKLIVLFLLLTGISQAQQSKSFEWYDSLTSSRTAVTVDVSGFLYVDVVFKGLATSDSLRLYNMTDSVVIRGLGSGGLQYSKFTKDTIPTYLRDLNLYTEVDSGMVKGLASPLDMAVLNPNLNKLYIKWTDSVFGHTIYLRVRGRNY